MGAYGKPVAFRSDKHGILGGNRRDAAGEEPAQFGCALLEPSIDVPCIGMPRARGRNVPVAPRELQ